MFCENPKYQDAWHFNSRSFSSELKDKNTKIVGIFSTTVLPETTERVVPPWREYHNAFDWKSFLQLHSPRLVELMSQALSERPLIDLGCGETVHDSIEKLSKLTSLDYVGIDGYEKVDLPLPRTLFLKSGLVSCLRALKPGSVNISMEWIKDYRGSLHDGLGAEDAYPEVLKVVPSGGILFGSKSDVLGRASQDTKNWNSLFQFNSGFERRYILQRKLI